LRQNFVGSGCGVSLLTDDHDNVDNVGTTTQQHEVTADQLPTTNHVTDALEENLSAFPTSEDIMLQSADDVDGMLNITESETEIELTADLSRPTDEVNGHRQNSSSDGKIYDNLSAVEIVSRSSEIIADTTVCSSSQCDVFTFQATLHQLSPQPRISC